MKEKISKIFSKNDLISGSDIGSDIGSPLYPGEVLTPSHNMIEAMFPGSQMRVSPGSIRLIKTGYWRSTQ